VTSHFSATVWGKQTLDLVAGVRSGARYPVVEIADRCCFAVAAAAAAAVADMPVDYRRKVVAEFLAAEALESPGSVRNADSEGTVDFAVGQVVMTLVEKNLPVVSVDRMV